MLTVFISGANGDIGCEITRQLVALDSTIVFAGARRLVTLRGETKIGRCSKIVPVHLDVTDDTSIAVAIENVKNELKGQALDILINCAGICTSISAIADAYQATQEMSVNCARSSLSTSSVLPCVDVGYVLSS